MLSCRKTVSPFPINGNTEEFWYAMRVSIGMVLFPIVAWLMLGVIQVLDMRHIQYQGETLPPFPLGLAFHLVLGRFHIYVIQVLKNTTIIRRIEPPSWCDELWMFATGVMGSIKRGDVWKKGHSYVIQV